MKHVAELMGSWSAERPVSLNSGRGCADALEAIGYRATRIDGDGSIADALKPVNEGSSFGVVIVKDGRADPAQKVGRQDLPCADSLLAERLIAARQLTCAIIGDHALGVIEIRSVSEAFYGYDAKYAKGGSRHVLPEDLKPNIYHKTQELTLMAPRRRGVSRAEFRYDETKGQEGELVCLGANTQPGMTETSLAPEMAAHVGFWFGQLVARMVEDAPCDR